MAIQRPPWCYTIIACLGPLIILACLGLLAGSNLDVFFEYGYGIEKNRVFVWETCFAAVGEKAAECVPVNSPRQCSELTSKLNAVGIMTAIAGFNVLLTLVSIIADVQGCKVPVKNLTRLFFAWSIVPTLFAVAVAVMGMVNAQCGATNSLEDQEGTYGPAFLMLAVSFFGQILGLLMHTCAMHLLGSGQPATLNDDDDDEEMPAIKTA